MPRLVSLRMLPTRGGATYDLHSHPFEEFTLVTDDECLIGYPPGWRDTKPNTLLHYHRGEMHGSWSSPRQRPRFWVVHFQAAGPLPHLAEANPARRAWSLKPEQVETFQWIFLQLLNEHSSDRPGRTPAASAWLQLLLVNVERWAARQHSPPISTPAPANAEVLRLWHQVNEAVSKPNDELASLYATPNYDSVRHAFRKAFGSSPREMLQSLRIEHAKNLLLESSLSIKEIAARVGYLQQHDFNRLFHRHAGMAPSKWRKNPLHRSAKG